MKALQATASALVVLLSLVATASSTPAQQLKDRDPGHRTEKWYTVTALPYLPPDIDSRAVAVVSVSSDDRDLEKGWSVTNVKVLSRDKGVTSVQLTAYVSLENELGSPVGSFVSQPIAFAKPLQAGEVADLSVDVIAHKQIVSVITEKRHDFRVDVAVTKAVYADGTVWQPPVTARLRYQKEIEDFDQVAFLKASYAGAGDSYRCYFTCTYHHVDDAPCPQQCQQPKPQGQGVWCTCGNNYFTCETPNPSATKCTLTNNGHVCTVTYPCS